ncbi:MAG: transcriptional regulator [Planctomycetaceae bacterium]|nr:transcriptional regulator [Planctomycetaceae bacterium]
MDERTFDQIDEALCQRTRLAIMASLAAVGKLDFVEIKARLNLTAGNLSVHLSALEKAQYVRIEKSFQGRKPLTSVWMTDQGRKALKRYVNLLQSILSEP